MIKLDKHLQKLEINDLIALRQNESELEYAFKHVFTQESVYKSLLRTDRTELHRQIGQTLELLFADNVNSHALLLAHHFEEGDDHEKAIQYLSMAADEAYNSYANKEAKELYSRVLALLDKQDYEQRWEGLAKREQCLDRLGERDQQANDLTLMQTLSELIEDDVRLSTTHNRRATYFDKISEYQAAAEAATVGLRTARRAKDARLEAQSLNLLALAAWRRFAYQEVKNWAQEALNALHVVGDPAGRITSLLHLGRASYRLGQYDTALEYIRAAQELAVETDDRENESLANLILGWIYQRLGDYELAEKHYQLMLDKRRLVGDRYGEATALSHLGWLAVDQHDSQQGIRYCLEALDISQSIEDRENEAYALAGLALNHEQLGHLEAATLNYQEALIRHQKIGATTLAIFDQAGLASIALAQQNLGIAKEHIQEVVDWIVGGNAQQFWDPWSIYLSAYRVLTALDETETAYQILEEAHQLLHQRAEQISDETLRFRFMSKVEVNKDIEEAWQKIQTDSAE